MPDQFQTVVFANGRFPESTYCLDLLESAKRVICCDGAANKLIAHGVIPEVIIGDLDSVSDVIKEKYSDILVKDSDQESNDLTKAVHYCRKQGHTHLTILGATGLREDHTLGNISLMLEYYPDVVVRILSDFGTFSLVESGETISSHQGETISIFSVDNRVKVSSTGLKFPLKELELNSWYTASLNESSGNNFTLFFDSEVPLILFRARGL